MKKRLLVLVIATFMALSIFGLTGCHSLDKIEVGFEGGRGAAGKYNNFFCGAKNDTVIFNVDDIKIDFYFGWATMSFTSSTPDWSVPDGYERIAIATYFYGYGVNGLENMAENEFADYHNIEGFYFVKEFPAEEFFTEKYKATYTTSGLFGRKGNTSFNYYETITVPKEILNKESGRIYFGVFDVLYLAETNLYVFNAKQTLHDDVRLSYENNVNGKVTIKGFAQK